MRSTLNAQLVANASGRITLQNLPCRSVSRNSTAYSAMNAVVRARPSTPEHWLATATRKPFAPMMTSSGRMNRSSVTKDRVQATAANVLRAKGLHSHRPAARSAKGGSSSATATRTGTARPCPRIQRQSVAGDDSQNAAPATAIAAPTTMTGRSDAKPSANAGADNTTRGRKRPASPATCSPAQPAAPDRGAAPWISAERAVAFAIR